MITQENITLGQRIAAPAPKFFKTIRNIGLTLVAAAGAIVAAPAVLPAGIVAVAGYIFTAGSVAVAVSSTAADFKKLNEGAQP